MGAAPTGNKNLMQKWTRDRAAGGFVSCPLEMCGKFLLYLVRARRQLATDSLSWIILEYYYYGVCIARTWQVDLLGGRSYYYLVQSICAQ